MAIDNPVPISPALQKSYRDTMLTPTAPSYLDPTLPIQPVAVIANTSTAASTVQISDGTDTATVTTQGDLNTAPRFASPSSAQTIVQKSTGKTPVAFTAGTGVTLHTVTATKTLYVTSMTFGNGGSSSAIEVRDGGSGGTIKYGTGTWELNKPLVVIFPTPLSFTTDVWMDVTTNGNNYWAFSGWEQ